MHSPKRHIGVEIPTDVISAVRARYEAGMYLQAYEMARLTAPLADWKGTDARIVAGRLAGNIGSGDLGRWLHARARLADKSDPQATYYWISHLLSFRGPYLAWRALEAFAPFAQDHTILRGELLALKARIVAQFRDFTRAEGWISEALKVSGGSAWIWCEKSNCLRHQDAFGDALAASQEALRIRPWYRPAVEITADLLQKCGRDAEALNLLREALEHIESGSVAAQLYGIEFELGEYQAALSSLARVQQLNPLFDDAALRWLEGRRADVLCRLGDFQAAAEHARKAGGEFYSRFAERLSTATPGVHRVHLPVEFVQQHHMTCAPATLSAVSSYWKAQVDHLALAETICYDGTPDHVERHWAEENGYVVREFSVTWEAAVALLDRGVPFTFTTTETTSAHLQAVIGYDLMRQTLLIRNPMERIHEEYQVEPLLKRYAPFGPRGMALVPAAEAHRLEGVELPDTQFYDLGHKINRSLYEHKRDAAQSALAAMEALDSAHFLTLFAKRSLAAYDASATRQLAAAEALLARFPNCNNFRWGKLLSLRALSRRAEYRMYLTEAATDKKSEPLFWREIAQDISLDSRKHALSRQYALRAMRWSPTDPESMVCLGDLLWKERRFTEAAHLYRLAACLREKVEHYGNLWFQAARHLRQTEEVLEWIRIQFDRFGRRSPGPARLLFNSLKTLGRTSEAFECLETALTHRPEDGALMLFAADGFARYGNAERAEALLRTAENHSSRVQWVRAAAAIANYRCDKARSLELWNEILEAEPFDIDAQRAAVLLIAELKGRCAALEYLSAIGQRFPHHVQVQRLWIEWLRDENCTEAEAVIRKALDLDPTDAWTRRELAVVLSRQQRFDEAFAEAEQAAQIDPANPYSYTIAGHIALNAGQRVQAREQACKALRLAVDTRDAISLLLAASDTLDEKRTVLATIHEELIRQVVFGEGLFAYRQEAFPVLEPAELLLNLQQAHAARPDLWHSWSVLVQHLTDMHRRDEALVLAKQATERFPLCSRLWFDLAKVYESRLERTEMIPALERALQLSPGWGLAAQTLADAFRCQSDLNAATRVLEQAVANAPLDAYNHGCLAEMLWLSGHHEDAVARLEHAVRLNPEYNWGWQSLASWSAQEGVANRAEALARELTQSRPGDAMSWYRLAQHLPANCGEQRLEALDRAIALKPNYSDAQDARAVILAEMNRFDEALAACLPSAPDLPVPLALRGRHAWIYAQKGDRTRAIDTIRSVLAESPDYYWGWSRLADWLTESKQYKEALEAAKALARLAPRSAIPLGYIANLQIQLGEKEEAFATLRRAFDLDPTYHFAAFNVFSKQLADKDIDAAEETLKRIETHLPGAQAKAARIRLLCTRGMKGDALTELRSLCLLPERNSEAIATAVNACAQARWQMDAEYVLEQLLATDAANPEAGAQWVKLFAQRNAWDLRSKLYRIDPNSPIGLAARNTFLNLLAEKKKPELLRKLVEREREALRRNTESWGAVGYAYVANALYTDGAHWLRDWRERPDVKPWMLVNLVAAFRVCGRDEEAAEANHHALTLRGDHSTRFHLLWVAMENAIAGNPGPAIETLSKIPADGLKGVEKGLHALTTALTDVLTAADANRRAVYNQHKAILRQPEFQQACSSLSIKSTAKRAVAKMAAVAGTRAFKLGRRSNSRIISSRTARAGSSSRLPVSVVIRSVPFLLWGLLMLLGRSCSDMNTRNPTVDRRLFDRPIGTSDRIDRPVLNSDRTLQNFAAPRSLRLEHSTMVLPTPYQSLPEPQFTPLSSPPHDN